MRNIIVVILTALLLAGPSAALADDTAFVQGLINTNTPIPCKTLVVNAGLIIPSGGASIRSVTGKCAILSLTANVTAISCSGVSSPVRISDITIIGNASAYTGYGTGANAAGQNGIQLHNCSNFDISHVEISNLNGNAIDCDEPASAFNAPWFGVIRGATINNNYKGLYTHAGCEYIAFSELQVRNNVFGVHIASGNINGTNNQVVFNSIGIKIEGNSTDTNPCHGTVSGSSFNHNTYNAIVQSCGVGETFAGDNFISDQSSSVPSGASAGIQLFNSRGIAFIGGQLGSDVTVTAADPVTGNTALNGDSLISQMYVRTDLANFSAPMLNAGTALLIKGNFDGSGLWSANN